MVRLPETSHAVPWFWKGPQGCGGSTTSHMSSRWPGELCPSPRILQGTNPPLLPGGTGWEMTVCCCVTSGKLPASRACCTAACAGHLRQHAWSSRLPASPLPLVLLAAGLCNLKPFQLILENKERRGFPRKALHKRLGCESGSAGGAARAQHRRRARQQRQQSCGSAGTDSTAPLNGQRRRRLQVPGPAWKANCGLTPLLCRASTLACMLTLVQNFNLKELCGYFCAENPTLGSQVAKSEPCMRIESGVSSYMAQMTRADRCQCLSC